MRTATLSGTKADLPPRERILDAARDLFYSRGIRCVSVDEIAAAAQTNKMTLYRHFELKDLLVAEYLRSLTPTRSPAMRSDAAYPGDPYAQLRALVAAFGDDALREDLRGCPMSNAAVEFPDKTHPAPAS